MSHNFPTSHHLFISSTIAEAPAPAKKCPKAEAHIGHLLCPVGGKKNTSNTYFTGLINEILIGLWSVGLY